MNPASDFIGSPGFIFMQHKKKRNRISHNQNRKLWYGSHTICCRPFSPRNTTRQSKQAKRMRMDWRLTPPLAGEPDGYLIAYLDHDRMTIYGLFDEGQARKMSKKLRLAPLPASYCIIAVNITGALCVDFGEVREREEQ